MKPFFDVIFNKNTLLQKRFWLFHLTIGWGEPLEKFVYASNDIEDVNQVYTQERALDLDIRNSFYVFDSHTGFQYEWPLVDEDGELISAIPSELKVGSEIPERLEACGCIQIDLVAGNGLHRRKYPEKALRRALSKRYYVFSGEPGWMGPGAENLFKTTNSLQEAKKIQREIGTLYPVRHGDVVDTRAVVCSHSG